MEKQKYYMSLDGKDFEVSKELYMAYMKGQRKERYFTHDLKKEHNSGGRGSLPCCG